MKTIDARKEIERVGRPLPVGAQVCITSAADHRVYWVNLVCSDGRMQLRPFGTLTPLKRLYGAVQLRRATKDDWRRQLFPKAAKDEHH